MTRRLSLQSVDSGCKKIVKNRSAEEVEINSKKQKRMDWPFFFFFEKKEEKRFFENSAATSGIEFNQACHTALLMFRRSEMSCVWTLSYLVSHAASADFIFLFLSKLLHWKKYIYFMFQKWLFVFVVSTLSLSPPVFSFLHCICVCHCGHCRHCLCTRKWRLTTKCIAYYHFSTIFEGRRLKNVKNKINDVLKNLLC